jgi:hypothetical protein
VRRFESPGPLFRVHGNQRRCCGQVGRVVLRRQLPTPSELVRLKLGLGKVGEPLCDAGGIALGLPVELFRLAGQLELPRLDRVSQDVPDQTQPPSGLHDSAHNSVIVASASNQCQASATKTASSDRDSTGIAVESDSWHLAAGSFRAKTASIRASGSTASTVRPRPRRLEVSFPVPDSYVRHPSRRHRRQPLQHPDAPQFDAARQGLEMIGRNGQEDTMDIRRL